MIGGLSILFCGFIPIAAIFILCDMMKTCHGVEQLIGLIIMSIIAGLMAAALFAWGIALIATRPRKPPVL